jgi:hypothetical protein
VPSTFWANADTRYAISCDAEAFDCGVCVSVCVVVWASVCMSTHVWMGRIEGRQNSKTKKR